jgi:hypothetical protein
MPKVQWDGKLVDKWEELTRKKPAQFDICMSCWDEISFGDLLAEELLKTKNGEPQDKYLAILQEDVTGVCCVCGKPTL